MMWGKIQVLQYLKLLTRQEQFVLTTIKEMKYSLVKMLIQWGHGHEWNQYEGKEKLSNFTEFIECATAQKSKQTSGLSNTWNFPYVESMITSMMHPETMDSNTLEIEWLNSCITTADSCNLSERNSLCYCQWNLPCLMLFNWPSSHRNTTALNTLFRYYFTSAGKRPWWYIYCLTPFNFTPLTLLAVFLCKCSYIYEPFYYIEISWSSSTIFGNVHFFLQMCIENHGPHWTK